MMATAKRADPYRKLLRILLVLLVVFVALVTAYFWLDRYQKANFDVRQKEIAEKNEQMMAEYKQTLAEQLKNISTTGETVSRPEPKAQGVDVVDLSSFPLAGGQDVVVTRGEALTGGLLLLNRWHALPADFVMVEGELKSIMAETNFRVPTKDNTVLLFPEAIKALDAFVAAAKADGVEYYNIYEGFRTMDEQTRMWRDEEAKHTARYSGDALTEITRRAVSYPGTSDYQSGFSFRVGAYNKDDRALNQAAFQTTKQAEYLNENGWKYGIVFRFPVQGFPSADTVDKSYITGINLSMNAYRYVGIPHAAIMHEKNWCLEEYIDYLIAHPHIAYYEDGVLKYEVVRIEEGITEKEISIPQDAASYMVSTDNMNGLVVAITY